MILTEEEFSQFKKANRTIFARVYNEYKKDIYNLLLCWTRGNNEESKDLLQETFCSAMASVSQLRNAKYIDRWLIIIAKRRLQDSQRSFAREKKYLKIYSEMQLPEKDITEKLETKRQIILLNLALKKIKPLYKDVLTLQKYKGKSVKEIADIINKTPKAVESIIFRAKTTLINTMDKLGKLTKY